MTIRHYERSYATARSVLGVLEVVGWITVAIGVLAALIGFGTGGLLGAMYRDPPFSARLISAIPGVITVVGGLFAVCYVQVSRAHVDTAEMTREMLLLARKESGGTPAAGGSGAGRISVGPAPGSNPSMRGNTALDGPANDPERETELFEKAMTINAEYETRLGHELIELYKDVRIWRGSGEFVVGGRTFASRKTARKYIDDQMESLT